MNEINPAEFHQMRRDLSELKGNVHKILELLGGNPIDKNDMGQIGVVSDLEVRVSKLERLKDKAVYILIGMTIPSSFGMASIIGWIIDHYKN